MDALQINDWPEPDAGVHTAVSTLAFYVMSPLRQPTLASMSGMLAAAALLAGSCGQRQ
jgi:hypothetical protein